MKFVRVGKRQLARFVSEFSGVTDLNVNDKVGFYEECELRAWVKRPSENLLYVAEYGGRYAGFCFAKIMSPHWGLIDTFYVKQEFRKIKVGSFLQHRIELALRGKVKYISRVTRSDNHGMHAFLKKQGYTARDQYTWFDRFL
jgi:GNAT superfamily N-acetyltransferase